MKAIATLLFALLTVTAAGCASTSKVRTQYEPDASFAGFATFSVAGPDPAGIEDEEFDPEVVEQAHKAAVAAMQAKGFREIEDADADLRVVISGELVDMVTVGQNNVKIPKESWVGYYPGTTQFEYRQGTITVDVVARETRALLWRGWSEKRLKGGQRPHAETVAAAVGRIIAEFPGEDSR